MNGRGKSDSLVVPASPPNKAAAAEAVEGRGLAKGNTDSSARPGLRAGSGVSQGLDRVRQAARRDKEARFTALLHHVSLERLVMAYWDLSPKAAPGVDGVTWQDYGQDLVANLRDLHDRVHSGRYRARPSRRAYIPKADGRKGCSASPRWRTRSSSGPSSRYSTPSTRRTSGVSPMGSGLGAARMMRWTRWRPGSSGGR
jgi:RNA-directed DNA polymerase